MDGAHCVSGDVETVVPLKSRCDMPGVACCLKSPSCKRCDVRNGLIGLVCPVTVQPGLPRGML